MRISMRLHIALTFAVLILFLPALVSAQDQPPKARITIMMSDTSRSGPASDKAVGDPLVSVGEHAARNLYTTARCSSAALSPGSIDLSQPATGPAVVGGVVGGGAGAPPPVPRPPTNWDYIWQVDVSPTAIAVDSVTFDMDWKRLERINGTMQMTAGDRRTLTLRQGERHPLDLVACAPGSQNANVLLEVQASPVEDAAYANVSLNYDVWLVHEFADGTKTSRHATLQGRQGEKLALKFAPIDLPLDVGSPANNGSSPFVMNVSGTVTGRVKPDGGIQISLQSNRSQGFADCSSGGVLSGAKVFEAKPGETTSIELPAGSGASGCPVPDGNKPTTPRPGVSITQQGTVQVFQKDFFAGSKTSIIVTAKRQG